jgi:hypothetical protein
MGSSFMMPQTTYNTPNPLNYNYPKIDHLRNGQYGSYPKFRETEVEAVNKPIESKPVSNGVAENLAKELESEIKELQQLTKEAKELAEKVKY